MKLLLGYLLLINVFGFFLMLADKLKAKKNLWRIPEKVLMGIAAVGGSLGILMGMRLFRHKTLHPKFSIGVPLFLAIHVVCAILILTKTSG
ncbi:MAG: DUF1294 domain-containing protein [Oscillospiraceae bacterium]|nr:DUF1294 domain-containing protein [Oscillospiraceae bacterium]